MKKTLIFCVIILIISSCSQNKNDKNIINLPVEASSSLDYVPNQEVAAKIAEAIWLPIYGDDILKYKPYTVKLKDDKTWVVIGTTEGIGGVPYIEIEKSDCKILKVAHGK